MDNQLNNQTPIQTTPPNSNPPLPKTEPPINPPQTPNPAAPTNPIVEKPVSVPTPPVEPPPAPPEIPSPTVPQIPVTSEPISPPPSTTEPIQPQPDITLADLGIIEKPPQNNFFKGIFIFSLIIFIVVISTFAFVYFKNQNNQKTAKSTPQNNPTNQNAGNCFLNDKTYEVGESFHAKDDCNICTCESPNNITCTDNRCSTEKPSTSSDVPASTSSAQKTTSTSSATTK